MTDYPTNHDLGRIDVIELDDTPALSRDVTLNIATIQAAWPDVLGLRSAAASGGGLGADSVVHQRSSLRAIEQ